LEDIGIWNNIETIENNLAKVKTKKEKRTALKQQINMCKVIVQVPSKDKYIFQFSKKGKQFDIQQLKENLLKLIEKSNVDNNQLDHIDHTDQLIKSIKDIPRNVIGRQLEHEWSDKKWKGRVEQWCFYIQCCAIPPPHPQPRIKILYTLVRFIHTTKI
jgi:hypothetical protein